MISNEPSINHYLWIGSAAFVNLNGEIPYKTHQRWFCLLLNPKYLPQLITHHCCSTPITFPSRFLLLNLYISKFILLKSSFLFSETPNVAGEVPFLVGEIAQIHHVFAVWTISASARASDSPLAEMKTASILRPAVRTWTRPANPPHFTETGFNPTET